MASITGVDDEVFIFLHITKTGGRTLEKVLRSMLKPKGGTWYDFDGSLKSYESFMALPPHEKDAFDALYGHFHYGIHETLTRPYRYVTLLRHPVDRVVSHYYHILEEPRHYLHEQVVSARWSLADYLRNNPPRDADNGSIRALNTRLLWSSCNGDVTEEELESATSNLFDQCELFGLTERFDESLILMAERFGWPDGSLFYERRNVTRTRPRKEDLDQEVLEVVRSTTSLEQRLYDRAAERFEATLAAQPASFHDRLRAFKASNPGSQATYNDQGVRIDGVHCTES